MTELYAQGDLLFERLTLANVSGTIVDPGEDGGHLLAEGEATGHKHVIYGQVCMFRDDGLACDLPSGLYVGHLKVADATVVHDEHAPLSLPAGTYRVRRQRQLEPRNAHLIAD